MKGNQPNLSIKNAEVIEAIPALRASGNSKMYVAAIGDPFTAKNGEEQIPVLLVQKTSRFQRGGDDFASISRGWNDRLLRKIENFTTQKAAELKLAVGKAFDDFHISVVRTLTPQYAVHQPMRRPTDNSVILFNGRPIFESYKITKETTKDEGVMEYPYDAAEVMETEGVESVRA